MNRDIEYLRRVVDWADHQREDYWLPDPAGGRLPPTPSEIMGAHAAVTIAAGVDTIEGALDLPEEDWATDLHHATTNKRFLQRLFGGPDMQVICYMCGADMNRRHGRPGVVTSGLCSAACEVRQAQQGGYSRSCTTCEICGRDLTPETAAWTDLGGLICRDCDGTLA